MFRTAPSRTPTDRLSTFFGASQPRASFEDVDIEEIGRLLLRCGHFAYKSPRTYIVLRTIGRLDLLQQLLSDGFDDGMFPVEKRGLPAFLDPRVRTSIFEAQDIILTKSLDLESGRHCHFHARGDLPFEILSYIGSGSFGQVRRIESKITFKQYALKTIRRQAAFKQSKQAVQEFLREMRIIKSLDHRHIIQYIGSYTDKRDLGLVLNSIAECDLATYLLMACTRPEWHATLRTFFGCLTTALCYLHDEEIRHRDIKPQNILVYKASVLLTDFGLSREALDTTYGPTAATSRYQAPEVAALERRNETADVWSLGCVFLEMLTALQGHDVEWLKSYYEEQGTHSSHPHANPEATRNLLRDWKATLSFDQAKPIAWIERMLVPRRDTRPTAADIMSDITSPEDGTGFMYSCNMCYGDWSDSDSYSSSIEDDSSTSSRSEISQEQRPTDIPRRISIFNQPLHKSIQYAAYDIAHIPFFCGGKTFSCSSPVPIVFGKCIEHILYIEGKLFLESA
jgi:serine/threonine protein kinase